MSFQKYPARLFVGLVALAIAVGLPALAHADSIYNFSMSTEPFADQVTAASPSAPYSLYFFLNSSGGPANTATLSNFNFGSGGSVTLPITLAYGLAAGDAGLGDQIVLSDDPNTSTLNGLIEGFNPGQTLSFNLDFTENLSDALPDQFGFAILDSSLSNVATTDSTASTFFTVNFNSSLSTQTYDIDPGLGIGSAEPVSLVSSAVPLPPTWAMVLALLPVVMLLHLQRRAAVIDR